MISTNQPHYLSPLYLLIIAALLLSWTSCREVNNMSGGNTFSGWDPTNEILRVCYDGWEENPETGVCECLPPKVVVAQYECRNIEPEDWYSSMSGCLVDQGIILQVKEPIHPDSIKTYTKGQIYVEAADTIGRHRNLYSHLGLIRFLPRGERFDSIQFYVPTSARLPYYVWPTAAAGYTDGYNTGFHGVILNDSTMVGQFVFGPILDPYELDRSRIFSSCDAIIRKGRAE